MISEYVYTKFSEVALIIQVYVEISDKVTFDLFTVCKSCLVQHLEEKNTCPDCNLVIHQSHPLQYISHDRTMQDIVYKLVPNLQESEYLELPLFPS